MILFNLVHVKKGNRNIICTVEDVDYIFVYLENRYVDKLQYIKNVNYDDFKDEVENGNKYEQGLYLLEIPNSLNVYRVSNKISYGYLYNKMQKVIKLVDCFDVELIENY